MPVSDPGIISRFVATYKGVEDFYFLNKDGDLGFIKSGELRTVKETFPQINDHGFRASNPGFEGEVQAFQRDLVNISRACGSSPPADLELGYVLPMTDEHEWHSATLALHESVLEALKADHQMMVQNGSKELVQAERDLGRIAPLRGIHQGLDELIHHQDAFGRHRYFPALFIAPHESTAERPEGETRQGTNIRVVNLRWRDAHDQTLGERPAASNTPRERLFALLRENLARRGAIDRSQRLENRLSIA